MQNTLNATQPVGRDEAGPTTPNPQQCSARLTRPQKKSKKVTCSGGAKKKLTEGMQEEGKIRQPAQWT